MATEQQGGDKMTPIGSNTVEIQVRPSPETITREQYCRKRVLELLSSPPPSSRGPGIAWWQFRQHLTGKVPGDQLRSTLDDLIDERIILECCYWVEHRSQEARRFALVQDASIQPEGYQLIQVRGHANIIAGLDLVDIDAIDSS